MNMDRQRQQGKNVLWNLVGNFVYAISVWLLTWIISKHSGASNYTDAAIFAVAASYANIFYVISAYGLRTFQVSDVLNVYSDEEYVASRFSTMLLGGGVCLVISVCMGYSIAQMLAINIYMLYQNFRAYADVVHGIIQKNGRLDICGISLAVRGIIKVAAFSAVLYFTNNLLIALCALALAGLSIIVALDIGFARQYYTGRFLVIRLLDKRIVGLLRNAVPMLLFAVFGSFTIYAPRIILEKISGQEAVSIFSYVYAPTISITTFASGIMLPFLPKMARKYKDGDMKGVLCEFSAPIGMMILIGAVAMIVSAWIGNFVLEILYDAEVAKYASLLVLTMLISTLWSLVYCCNNLLVTMRCLQSMTVTNGIGFVLTIGFCLFLIPQYSMFGAAFAMALGILLQLALTLMLVRKKINLKRGDNFWSRN